MESLKTVGVLTVKRLALLKKRRSTTQERTVPLDGQGLTIQAFMSPNVVVLHTPMKIQMRRING